MADVPDDEAPDGAAVFPLIPAELGVDPLLLAVLHAAVFLSGSDDAVVHPDAADEAMEYLATYLQRLDGERLRKVREDLVCLGAYGRQREVAQTTDPVPQDVSGRLRSRRLAEG